MKILKHLACHGSFRFIATLMSVKYRIIKKTPFCLPFGKAGDPPISGACVHKRMPKFAVGYYGFSLGRLGSGASSTFAQFGYFLPIHHPGSRHMDRLLILPWHAQRWGRLCKMGPAQRPFFSFFCPSLPRLYFLFLASSSSSLTMKTGSDGIQAGCTDETTQQAVSTHPTSGQTSTSDELLTYD